MTPSEWKEKKVLELKKQKVKPYQKISNNFIDNAIHKNNAHAIKTIFYLASIIDTFDFNKELDTIIIDLRKMFKYTGLTAQEARDNFRAMQKTSITFLNEAEEWEENITLVPRIKFHYGKNLIEIDLYSKIAKLIIEVKNNYTFINTASIMKLKSKHSLRILPLLETIRGYDEDIPKRKKMSLNALNDFFGTKYKTIYEIERKILNPVKEELDINSNISFIFETHTENLGKGRPKATHITLDVVSKEKKLNKNIQRRLIE
ncbi:MAG TPA: RepB family plasmid replication initiator protein [Arcobacter sp.]|nr:RepB family plasmid replication initiator protein [Arcobacter sp.]